ncbi:FkbM family methyltransferase [Trichothermofontia sichuanensis B231]|uniref:FkbM family methyltransferase n=1 Tax=Trichothermofontia sichuanensis TaxID=3045816 RepID=UPI002245383D|nr:FkbM family methyltransferase [Trichothermofontia sichuanensis]UZQ55316.1 FkbM family methyltransferase [Trichothermofontia sichuanensis B231]
MYPHVFLATFYKMLLSLTSSRGEHTLAKLDAAFFPVNRRISFGEKAEILIPPDPHLFRYLIKSHEKHISVAITYLCKAGDTVVDVGANIGYFTAYAADRVGESGRIFAFEPEPKNFKYLYDNCHRLAVLGFNCKAYPYAVSSRQGKAVLNLHRFSTYHTIEPEQNLDKVEGQITVNLVTLDDWAEENKVDHIHFLKVDTEGHEKDVLSGAQALFNTRSIDYTMLECRNSRLSSFIDDFSKNFNLHQLVWDGKNWHQANLLSFDYKTECLLCKEPLSPEYISPNPPL